MRASWDESFLDRGNSKCKGPKAEICLVCSRDKEANAQTDVNEGRAVVRDKVTEKEGSQIMREFVRPTKGSLWLLYGEQTTEEQEQKQKDLVECCCLNSDETEWQL